jgi:hypothetical protein
MIQTRRSSLLDAMSYAALTILVWGVSAFHRGLWQDDVQALGEAFQRLLRSFGTLFDPDASPLRRLTLLPSALALATPQPIWALHVLSAVIWLGHGLLAGWIVSLLLPGRRRTQFLVACLTLTATSDLTTGSIVPLAYNFAILLLLASIGCALLWLGRGRVVALVASPLLLAGSLLTMDVSIPALPFLLLLLWFVHDRRQRLVGLLLAWGAVIIPIAVVEWSFLHDRASYAAMAILTLTKYELVTRSIALWLLNFAPWRWAFVRPDWHGHVERVIPIGWMALGALAAVGVFMLRLRGKEDRVPGPGSQGPATFPQNASASVPGTRHPGPLFAGLFAVMALAANAAYATIWFSELHYRTHILSRVWISMALGILAGWAAARGPALGRAALAVVAAFIFLGTWGGIERQDYFLAAWRWHQRELGSIVDAAPALRPSTYVVLRGSPPAGRYIATEADYLAKHWLRLLYRHPGQEAIRLDPLRGAVCTPAAGNLECRLEGQAHCLTSRTCEPVQIPFEALVLMDYDQASGTYRLIRSLRDDPLAGGSAAAVARYHPEARIVAMALTPWQRHLLLRD